MAINLEDKGATVKLVKTLSDDIRTLPNGTKATSAGAVTREVYSTLKTLNAYDITSGLLTKTYKQRHYVHMERRCLHRVRDIYQLLGQYPAILCADSR